jgi:hypothetical protein
MEVFNIMHTFLIKPEILLTFKVISEIPGIQYSRSNYHMELQ